MGQAQSQPDSALASQEIPDSGHSCDESRVLGVVVQLLAQSPDRYPHNLVLAPAVQSPYVSEDVVLCDCLSLVDSEVMQKAILGGGKPHGLSVDGDLSREEIDVEIALGEGGLPLGCRGQMCPSQDGFDSGQERLSRKGFRHIVICPQSQALDHVFLSTSGGEHYDGDVGNLPDSRAHLEAVMARQHDVQDDQLGESVARPDNASSPVAAQETR